MHVPFRAHPSRIEQLILSMYFLGLLEASEREASTGLEMNPKYGYISTLRRIGRASGKISLLIRFTTNTHVVVIFSKRVRNTFYLSIGKKLSLCDTEEHTLDMELELNELAHGE